VRNVRSTGAPSEATTDAPSRCFNSNLSVERPHGSGLKFIAASLLFGSRSGGRSILHFAFFVSACLSGRKRFF
jgi:hypothetical protein